MDKQLNNYKLINYVNKHRAYQETRHNASECINRQMSLDRHCVATGYHHMSHVDKVIGLVNKTCGNIVFAGNK